MTIKKQQMQVAVAVDISGVRCRIVGAKDRGDKGIIFTPHSSLNLEDGDRSLPIREEHVSAWPNEKSQKVHIHHTFHLKDEKIWKIDQSTLADNRAKDFAAAIWSTSIPQRADRIATPIKPKYQIRNIPSYNESDTCLVVCYTVATPGRSFPNLLQNGISLLEIAFSTMRIGLYYTYVNFPSYVRGIRVSMSTSMYRVNNGPTSNTASVLPHVMDDLAMNVKMQIQAVINDYLNRVADDMAGFGMSNAELQSTFHSGQIYNSPVPLSMIMALGIRGFGSLEGARFLNQPS